MEPLIKGMYMRRKSPSNRFGLRNRQMRGPQYRFAKNCGWYNKHGELLGHGDLSLGDVLRIYDELRHGLFTSISADMPLSDLHEEYFILLRQYDAELHFLVKRKELSKKYYAPGKAYIIKHAMYVIAPEAIYHVNRENTRATAHIGNTDFSIQLPVISEHELRKRLYPRKKKHDAVSRSLRKK